jgi:uncharacterized protein (DUF2164 family)
MQKEFNSKFVENIIYTLIWLLIFLMPIFFSGYEYEVNWRRVFHEWIRFVPFLLIFLINNSLLVPKLLFENNYRAYIISTILAVLLIAYLGSQTRIIIEFFEKAPPRRFVQPEGFRPPPGLDRPPSQQVIPWHVMFFNNVIVTFLIVGFNAAIKLSFQWAKNEREKRELEKVHLQSELNFLKHQISPHFFMNTLNNIHALIDIEKEDAKEAIIRLSKMMRHLLYDAERGKTTLKKEFEFIKTYIDLMKLRFSSNVKIQINFPDNISDEVIPPLLFTSLLENAFKYGVSYQKESFIEVAIELKDGLLQFSLRNSKHENDKDELEKGGIGLSNLKKRLNLLYGDRYDLTISDGLSEFFVNLKIPVHLEDAKK